MNMDPALAARYAIVATCLILIGAILTAGALSIEQRGGAMVTVFAILAGVAWRFRIER